MEPKGSLARSQEPATDPYSEPDESSPYPRTLFFKIHSNIILLFTLVSSNGSLIPSGFPTKCTSHVSHAYYMSRLSSLYSNTPLMHSRLLKLRLCKWADCDHGMVLPQVADAEDRLQMCRVRVDMLKKQSRTAGKGWSSSFEFWPLMDY
jgi:hypothetical protein